MAPSPKIPAALLACVFGLLACRDREASRALADRDQASLRRNRQMIDDTARCEETRSAAVCQSACDLGNSNSCARAAALARADGDTARADDLYQRACVGGSGLGCAGAGEPIKARFYTRVHCEQLDHADSCLELSRIFRDGRGGPADANAAFTFRERACKLGSAQACEEL